MYFGRALTLFQGDVSSVTFFNASKVGAVVVNVRLLESDLLPTYFEQLSFSFK